MPCMTGTTTAVLLSVITTQVLAQSDAGPPPLPPPLVAKGFSAPTPVPAGSQPPAATLAKLDDQDPRMVMLSVRMMERYVPGKVSSETKEPLSDSGESSSSSVPESKVASRSTTSKDRYQSFLTKDEVADFLKSCQSDRRTKILSTPNLLLPIGQKGHFHSGGEFVCHVEPATFNDQGEEVTPERKHTICYGTILAATVTALKPDALRIEITVEESTLQKNPGLPVGKLTRCVQTVVECPVGQSVIIRGLKAKRQNESMTRIPILGELPVLDSMFSKKSVEPEEVEFVVLITPELVDVPE